MSQQIEDIQQEESQIINNLNKLGFEQAVEHCPVDKGDFIYIHGPEMDADDIVYEIIEKIISHIDDPTKTDPDEVEAVNYFVSRCNSESIKDKEEELRESIWDTIDDIGPWFKYKELTQDDLG